MLKIQFKDKRQPSFWVMDKSFSIGSSSTSHCTIVDPSVSGRHAEIVKRGNSFILKDLSSAQGTFVNRLRINEKDIFCGDLISFGDVNLEVVDPLEEIKHQAKGKPYWSLIADSSWLSGQEFPLIGEVGEKITVGRSSQSKVVFPGTHLSRLHAEITINHSSLTLTDMGSANGTFVNDEKITSAKVYPGDRIRLDVYGFRVFGPGIKLACPATASIDAMPSPEEIHGRDIKLKSTSPGNREELNLYKKHPTELIIASLIAMGILALATYVGLGVTDMI